MKRGALLCFGVLLGTAVGVSCGAPSLFAQSSKQPASTLGKLSGQVRDASGIPQLGATVAILSETPGATATYLFLTNTEGIFTGEKLAPGSYTVRVTLAGFLPFLEKHIQISPNLTTTVRIRLESMFASIEQLRRPPAASSAEADDWKWVLRSAPELRPVLHWDETDPPGTITSSVVVEPNVHRPLGIVALTDGARRPGSVSNVAAAPSTAFAYDQKIAGSNHIVFAGQITPDEESPAGGIASVWLPTGSAETGPSSTLVLREAKLGNSGLTFRGVRLDQSETLALGSRFLVRAGGEYVLVGLGAPASGLRARVKLETRVTSNWYADAIYAALPNGTTPNDALNAALEGVDAPGVLTDALNQLDTFPALLMRGGRPVLESGRHEELAAERKLGTRGVFQIAAFHDDYSHVALFGRGNSLPPEEFFQEFFSKGFAYDGGASSDWGGRVALREKLNDEFELTAIYAFSGALVPIAEMDGGLRDGLRNAQRQSVAMKVAARIPKSGTHLTAGYKWINDTALSRVDPYGEAAYQVSPYLNVGIRQPLPRMLFGRWEANAECDNLLAQGYFSLNTRDGQLLLVPAFRSFRGGVSLQF
ncbi:MAG TPA: carboxypeptidase-like regulatory domain-containing protein [Candidatus Acidoferrum sp.]|nr:carboxypeptidase-like regulatory domain-containing protein [Candidatus Acidoferrum sp.]